jgi:hypothetical protein
MTRTTDRMRGYGRILCNPVLIALKHRERLSLQSANLAYRGESEPDLGRAGLFNYADFGYFV